MKKHIKLLSLLLAIICAFSVCFVSCEKEEPEETEAEEIIKTEAEKDETEAPSVTESETTLAPETEAPVETTAEETTAPAPETTAHTHSYTSTENTASCTQEVKVVHSCACGDSYTETLAMIDHNFVNNACSMCGLVLEVYSKGLEFTLNDDKKSYSLVGIGTCTDVDIIIPSKHEGLPVTSIESNAFKGNKDIKSLVIPESIKTIGISVFNDADSLASITFENGVTKINTSAFYSCDSLTEIVLPESLRTVGSNVFASCKNLKKIILNEGLTEIGSGSFEAYSPFGNYNDEAFTFYGNGKYLGTKDNPYYAFYAIPNPFNTTSCEIHKDTKVIAEEAFANSIIEELTIPSGVEAINFRAFSSAIALKTLKFEGTVQYMDPQAIDKDQKIIYNEYEGASYLGNDANPYLILISVNDKTKDSYVIHPNTKQIAGNAFRDCTALKSFVIPEHITVLGNYCFASCTALTSIVISKNITEIPEGFLNGCESITEFTVTNHITSIGGYAFGYCSALSKFIIKNNVKYIGENVFSYCLKLKSIDFYGTKSEFEKIQKSKNWNISSSLFGIEIAVNIIEPVTLDAGASEGITYTKSADGKYYSVSSIGLCTDTDIVISSTCNGLPVEIISKNAFEGCTNITSVTIPSSVKNIDSYAFKNCTSLKKVTIIEGAEKISFLAFEGCTALEEVNIPSTCFVANGFIGCTSLKTLNIDPANEKFKMIGNCLIYNDKAKNVENALVLILGEQTIPSDIGIKCIMSNAFYHSEIEEIIIPEGVTGIEASAFDASKNLKKVTLPESLISIGSSAFRDCVSLEEIFIPNNVTDIEIGAFNNCSNLKKVTLPESLVSIGNGVFASCTSLESIFIPKNVNVMGINPFNSSGIKFLEIDPSNKTFKVVDNCLINIASKTIVSAWSESKIPNDGSVTVIGQASFSGNTTIKNIEINDHITKIESGAFMKCHGVETLIIPDSVTEIGSTAIYNMDGLKELVIGNGVKSLDCISASTLKNLQKLTIGSGITIIEKYDLMSCNASEIILPKSIKKLEASAMCYCSNLTAIRYEGTVAEWNAIEKESGWDNGSNNYTVYCIDGEIKK